MGWTSLTTSSFTTYFLIYLSICIVRSGPQPSHRSSSSECGNICHDNIANAQIQSAGFIGRNSGQTMGVTRKPRFK
ncbi:hypothetical protein BDV93DRAFT_156057 [Ceratobasidium sp. AG-I]|nr:hypothetical protein BDV93DRAFT_156057 [Ceratobasidium sp. AG-I]